MLLALPNLIEGELVRAQSFFIFKAVQPEQRRSSSRSSAVKRSAC